MTRHRIARRVAVSIFVGVAVVLFAFALIKAWDDTNGELPSVSRLVIAGVLWGGGLLVGAWAWATVLGGRRLDHGAGMLVSQLAKYVPGGIWQATGQVGLARSAGIPVSQGVTAFSVLAVCQAIAGCSYGIVLALTWSDAAVVVRVLCAAAAVATIALLDRRWMVWVLHKIPRTREASADLVPPQRMIVLAWLASIVTLAATGTAYVVLLGSFGPIGSPLFVVAAYAAAWTVGFVVAPIPSGVGVREAVLVFILHGTFVNSVLVATSVYHRLASLAAEGVMAALATHRLRPRRQALPRTEPD